MNAKHQAPSVQAPENKQASNAVWRVLIAAGLVIIAIACLGAYMPTTGPISSVQFNSNGVLSGSSGFVFTNGAVKASNIWDKSNVKFWGAQGDGVTDDRAAIQACMDSGENKIYFPSNTYTVLGTLYGRDNQTLYSDDGAVISCPLTNHVPIRFSGKTNFTVRGLTLIPNGTWYDGTYETNRSSIVLVGCTNGIIENCRLLDFAIMGALLYDCQSCVVRDCWISSVQTNAYGAGVALYGNAFDNRVSGCRIGGSISTGVAIISSTNYSVGGCTSNNIVQGNTISGCIKYGVCDYSGTGSIGCFNNTISGNVIHDITGALYDPSGGGRQYGAGIYLQSTVGNLVSANVISRCTTLTDSAGHTPGGIGLALVNSASLTDNVISDVPYTSGAGIYIYGDATATPPPGTINIVGGSISRSYNGVLSQGQTNVSIKSVSFSGITNYNVYFTGASRLRVAGCTFLGLNDGAEYGVRTLSSKDISVSGNVFDVIKRGVFIPDGNGVSILGNIFKANPVYAVNVTATNAWVDGNHFISNAVAIYNTNGFVGVNKYDNNLFNLLGDATTVSVSQSIFETQAGYVGFGTTAPSQKLHVSGDTIRLDTARTPASAAAAGLPGEICWDASFIYVCTATNTWKRTAIATW